MAPVRRHPAVLAFETMEDCMLARNASTLIGALVLTAAVAGAQQPAKQPTTHTASHPTTTTQAPTQAKHSSKTSAATAMPVSTDSAKKVVMANAAGATISATKLHHKEGKAYYAVTYKVKGNSKTMHATVDANTGAFTAGSEPASASHSSAKKPT